MTTLKVAFAGTPEFSVPCLKALIEMSQVEVVAVYTQPDRPVGRGRKLLPTPVKQAALDAGIAVRQPEKLNNQTQLQAFAQLQVDVMIVVAYGLLLTQNWLNTPRLGCVNVHASLLPRWRGAAPIQRAILAGDKETGVCLMQMHKQLDAGPVFARQSMPIASDDTAGTLHDKLRLLGAQLLRDNLVDFAHGKLPKIAQDENSVTYAHKLDKQEGVLNWQQNAQQIVNQIHAFNPWPVVTTQLDAMALRLLRAHVVESDAPKLPVGTIVRADTALHVQAADKLVAIDEIQKPGAKALPVQAFLAGNAMSQGQVMGQ